jgi:HEPN domain-containing protein/DNA-directed RNA polymerase subunit RPC12/RpoP
MKTADDPNVTEALVEAEEDLADARDLARRSGGTSMALYHSAQAAEKFLGALAVAADHKLNVMWDLPRIHEALRETPDLADLSEPVGVLAEFTTPRKVQGASISAGVAIRAAEQIRRAVLVMLGVAVPAEPETPLPAGGLASAPVPPPVDPEQANRVTIADAPPPEQEFPGVLPDMPVPGSNSGRIAPNTGPGRSDRDRRTSYVKVFLVCATCGVRIPRTRQTSGGRIPCPHCGRPMQPVS